jgi:Holliday junction resolvase RusA-like endonuclease
MAIWIEWHRGRTKKGTVSQAKMDGDNILKSVKDALSGLAYEDDKQIKFEACHQIPTNYGTDRIVVWLGVLR